MIKLSKDDQEFVIGFCKKAAELGVTPQELLAVKQSNLPLLLAAASGKTSLGLAALLAAGTVGTGALAGGGAAYLKHKMLPPVGGSGAGMTLAEEDLQRQLAEKFRQATLDARMLDLKRKQRKGNMLPESMDEPIFAT